jgi:hypothetical protein
MTTKETTSLVHVNTRLVGHEVTVNAEGDFNRSIGVDLVLHVLRSSGGNNLVNLVGYDSGAIIASSVAIARVSLSAHVLEALVGGDTSVLKELPRVGQVSTITAVIGIVAAYQVLRAQRSLILTLNAESVTQNFCCSEGPA